MEVEPSVWHQFHRFRPEALELQVRTNTFWRGARPRRPARDPSCLVWGSIADVLGQFGERPLANRDSEPGQPRKPTSIQRANQKPCLRRPIAHVGKAF